MNQSYGSKITTRRSLLKNAALSAAAAVAVPAFGNTGKHGANAGSSPSSFANLIDHPTFVTVFVEEKNTLQLDRTGDTWVKETCMVDITSAARGLSLGLVAPFESVLRVHVRWRVALPAAKLRVLSDAWERSYGDLGWREVIPECPLPWYFLTFDGERTHGYGVAVGAAALAFWQCDRDGISLWLDVRNGGKGVKLGERTLPMATVVVRAGEEGESPLTAARAFCRLLSPLPKKSAGPIYGSNDWYYAYGNNTPEGILRDAALVAELAPVEGTRPFTIVDMGWEDKEKFPDMAGLAEDIRKKGVRPGIWIRPTQPVGESDPLLLLPPSRFASSIDAAQNPSYDPTIPEGRDKALEKIRRVKAWKFELIKHDFSTYDLLGRWGFSMGSSPTLPGWSFHDRSRTSAEIIRGFYQAISDIAGDSLVIGCNTIGHLGAGIFDAQRIGDDVSGKVWERTRRMGVNTLAFRLAQHRAFFAADADCVPFTSRIPWERTRQWLDVVAKSGTVLLISPEPGAVGPEMRAAIQSAFAIAAKGGQSLAPVDWLETHTPYRWQADASSHHLDERYDWLQPEGALPFEV